MLKGSNTESSILQQQESTIYNILYTVHVYWLLLQCQNTTRFHAYCYKQIFRLEVLQKIINREKRNFRME